MRRHFYLVVALCFLLPGCSISPKNGDYEIETERSASNRSLDKISVFGDSILHVDTTDGSSDDHLWAYSGRARNVAISPVMKGTEVNERSEILYAAWIRLLARLAAGNTVQIEVRHPPGTAGIMGPKPLVIQPSDIGNIAFDANGAKKSEVSISATRAYRAIILGLRNGRLLDVDTNASETKTDSQSTSQTLISLSPRNNLIPDSAQSKKRQFEISSISLGYLITGWIRIEGKRAGISIFEHTWIAEIRHHIHIIPKFASPTQDCIIVVFPELRERPNVNYAWQSGDVELGRVETADLYSSIMKLIFQVKP